MAGSFGMSDQFSNTGAWCATHNGQLDRHVFEKSRSIVDVVFLGVAERRPHVSRRIFDRDIVEWREPRQLGEQSKGSAHHHILQRRRAFLGAAPRQRFVGFDHESPARVSTARARDRTLRRAVVAPRPAVPCWRIEL